MKNIWSLDTHGDPLGKLRGFFSKLWLEANLDGMLVTLSDTDSISSTPIYITDIKLVKKINPFKPLMEMNAARLIPVLIHDHPGENLAALLRPCEMRALIEITKHNSVNLKDLITISVDCLGTLPADEYQWRLERMGKNFTGDQLDARIDTKGVLALETLKFARQGGIVPYRYRSACQVCTSPAANQAAINIHILGIPVRQHILVECDPTFEQKIHIADLVDGKADSELVLQHERLLSKMSDRHQRTMERVNEGLSSLLPADVDAVIDQLESCGDCQNCMDVCPICFVDRPTRSSSGHYDRTDIIRWLVSCAGCGMCEQSCPNHLPLSTIFAHIRQQLDMEWDYVPGRSMDEPLPLI